MNEPSSHNIIYFNYILFNSVYSADQTNKDFKTWNKTNLNHMDSAQTVSQEATVLLTIVFLKSETKLSH